MSTLAVLESLQSFLQEKVAPTIQLQKADDDNIQSYELVNPQVHIGWIPPKGYLPAGMESAIPCLIVGMDDANRDSQDAEVNIRISAAVYSPGLHTPKTPVGLNYTPDFDGYRDLLNLIDRTVDTLGKNRVLPKGTVDEVIKWGMYQEEQPYPYWYGWITLTIKKPSSQPTQIVHDLL